MDSKMIISIICGLLFGLLVAFINMLISKKNLKSDNVGLLMGTNAVRMLLDIAAMAIGYFFSEKVGLMLFPVLISIAIGLSIGGLVFLKVILNKTNSNGQNNISSDQ